MTRVLAAVKRVADTSGEVVLTEDGQGLDGRFAGWTIGDHDACAVELAIRVAEAGDGSVTVLSVGAPEAVEQIRSALALGAGAGILVETDPSAMGPADVAAEIAAVVSGAAEAGEPYDLVVLGNDAADTGDFQVPIRLAHLVGRPIVTGARMLEVADGVLVAQVQGPYGDETYELPLPAVAAVLEGGAEPRYPSLRGRMAAKKVEIDVRAPAGSPSGSGRVRWHVPPAASGEAEVLGEGPAAAPAVVEVLERLGVLR
ncbi:electron transfer flavoprotein subunit beta/FixA family protein [Nocardioides euryhalodurans]|uniref:Electron transfer flavoprotein subunit beta/FixA family protein n=1 Tax=Nocardioides euryhalodurans TaxID=2518370 RepID=A0A4V1BDS0_9ACTN|nr:electron transfer flavoprotein subunit beta/FixA family protein [Nocardioides euryhalodurans]QBR92092.1 electron transfer flavoprotein subunit beta/FixA family protein [Nocardioides euryhalodurans]